MEILDHFLSELSQSSEHTRQGRAFYAQKFLSFAGDRPLSEWNKSLVNDFLRQVRKEGYAPGTIRSVYGIVKRVFDSGKAVHEAEKTRLISEVDPNAAGAIAQLIKALSLPGPNWDLGKRSAPRVEAEDMVKPATTFEEMEIMIAAARDGILTSAEKAYLALSSIYGFRREELCRVRPDHLDFGKKTIYVLTCKGGERRNQLLCDEVIPYLQDYGFKEGISPYNMSAMYWRIMAKSGLKPKEGSGWHSNRRYLDTVLLDLCGELETKIYLRWKMSSSSEMVQRYYSRDPLDVDDKVLSTHPLVPLWRS